MKSGFIVILTSCILALGCDSQSEDLISLDAEEQFSYDLNVYGDEEGARIIEQAKHYSRSEIIRDSATSWGAYYYYVPAMGYRGFDYVTIETCTGGKGTHCDDLNMIEFKFHIEE